jgi:hypothetical protein
MALFVGNVGFYARATSQHQSNIAEVCLYHSYSLYTLTLNDEPAVVHSLELDT